MLLTLKKNALKHSNGLMITFGGLAMHSTKDWHKRQIKTAYDFVHLTFVRKTFPLPRNLKKDLEDF